MYGIRGPRIRSILKDISKKEIEEREGREKTRD